VAEQRIAPAPEWRRSVVIGFLNVGAYLLVLTALSVAPLALVSPVRESAIVLVAVWGVWRMRERQHLVLKLGGAAAVLGGIVLIAVRG
jgi:drug/metabolite transporter (DMT)-like permease